MNTYTVLMYVLHKFEVNAIDQNQANRLVENDLKSKHKTYKKLEIVDGEIVDTPALPLKGD